MQEHKWWRMQEEEELECVHQQAMVWINSLMHLNIQDKELMQVAQTKASSAKEAYLWLAVQALNQSTEMPTDNRTTPVWVKDSQVLDVITIKVQMLHSQLEAQWTNSVPATDNLK